MKEVIKYLEEHLTKLNDNTIEKKNLKKILTIIKVRAF
jgi:uncharacterized protein YtpQ (UPF0354 family)